MRLLVLAIVIALMIACSSSRVYGDIGTATYYKPPYMPTRCYGNRPEQFPPSKHFVRVGEGLWDNGAACGRRYRMRCLSGPNRPCKQRIIEVKVVDFCSQQQQEAHCPSTTIQLSVDAYALLSHKHASKICWN